MKRDVLERPFEAGLIKSRKGPGGKPFSYAEGIAPDRLAFALSKHYKTRLDTLTLDPACDALSWIRSGSTTETGQKED